jgi:hypothetical protein
MDLPTRRTGHNPSRGSSADWWVLTTTNIARTNGLTCLPKHGGARHSHSLCNGGKSIYKFNIIITSSLQSTAGHRHLQFLATSLDLVTPPGLRASCTTFTETQFPLQNSFNPAVVGSTANMASPLPLQHANTVCYVGDLSSLPVHVLSDSNPQRNLVYLPRLQSFFCLTAMFARGRHSLGNFEDGSANRYRFR